MHRDQRIHIAILASASAAPNDLGAGLSHSAQDANELLGPPLDRRKPLSSATFWRLSAVPRFHGSTAPRFHRAQPEASEASGATCRGLPEGYLRTYSVSV